MRQFFLRTLVVLAVLVAWPAFAQASADFSLEVRLVPPGPIVPGTLVQIELTFRNLGPDDAVGTGAVSSDYPFLTGGFFDLFDVLPHACHVDYDDFVGPPGVPGESFLIAIILAGSIPAGGTRVCTLGLFVYPESRGRFDLSFRADAAIPDNNASNDSVTLGLVFAEPTPRTIPSTDAWALLSLGALLLVVALANLGHGFGRA